MSDEPLFEKRSLSISRAALSPFTAVEHWNAWFDGMICKTTLVLQQYFILGIKLGALPSVSRMWNMRK